MSSKNPASGRKSKPTGRSRKKKTVEEKFVALNLDEESEKDWFLESQDEDDGSKKHDEADAVVPSAVVAMKRVLSSPAVPVFRTAPSLPKLSSISSVFLGIIALLSTTEKTYEILPAELHYRIPETSTKDDQKSYLELTKSEIVAKKLSGRLDKYATNYRVFFGKIVETLLKDKKEDQAYELQLDYFTLVEELREQDFFLELFLRGGKIVNDDGSVRCNGRYGLGCDRPDHTLNPSISISHLADLVTFHFDHLVPQYLIKRALEKIIFNDTKINWTSFTNLVFKPQQYGGNLALVHAGVCHPTETVERENAIDFNKLVDYLTMCD